MRNEHGNGTKYLTYGIFPSPLGDILIASSAEGVACVEFLRSRGKKNATHLLHFNGFEKDGAELRKLYRSLREYLQGKRRSLGWPLDRSLITSEFHRDVLRVTEQIPYGAVMTYKGVAEAIGRPRAIRATARALRWNPLPIVIPCHRVIGTSGHLTGYAGRSGIPMKAHLLALEGIPLQGSDSDLTIRRGRMYVGRRRSKLYCLPTCPRLREITPQDTLLFGSRLLAESAGLSPCRTCRPDRTPLRVSS